MANAAHECTAKSEAKAGAEVQMELMGPGHNALMGNCESQYTEEGSTWPLVD